MSSTLAIQISVHWSIWHEMRAGKMGVASNIFKRLILGAKNWKSRMNMSKRCGKQ